MGYPIHDPEIQAKTIALKAAGLPNNYIASQIDTSNQTVGRILEKPGIQEHLKKATDHLINTFLPAALDNFKYWLTKRSEFTDKQDKYLAYRASERTLESMGILSSHATSYQLTQIINQTTTIISPVIEQLLAVIPQRNGNLPDLDDSIE